MFIQSFLFSGFLVTTTEKAPRCKKDKSNTVSQRNHDIREMFKAVPPKRKSQM